MALRSILIKTRISQKCVYPFTALFSNSSIETINKNEENSENWKKELHATMKIFPDFLTQQEEDSILKEMDPYLKRLRYEFSHWDNAIHGYRETERAKWNEENTKIIDKVRTKAFPPGTPQLAYVHVLDLSAEGWIKPHVDSIRFCGDVIAGISLLSDCVMRLSSVEKEDRKEDFFLPRRSLYIMSGLARQKYNHEVLSAAESIFQGKKVPRARRISVICRTEPDPQVD
ncbi:alpha-ketoglutarate-dependent dioxygenase alkB homolog 7, mitochondrial [Belonocnema kinseyi]|uniref:alpha-ketoglutarate-dependent dioxygenase alkB homolog 7, mitochondrial n=1 Tax=Belonocnema kinseyi TaxID=2817044 RepID=UPI00143DCACB|nr:alpha-ketoglutarate-dependent dioxygenase alkB homolog 7, mitochondrial [Belonocnema kinseyi]XP_033219513.1 alpha-ketoglutarate-dependent dioxygenase alkB homolog 7, mitochondrial [Belonocnema kinseyi]XP_033219514.1 alpha-ketoglutarate-dependent dioxygenase alkB homolog 7, mitochondrial [Belonocnema kinseyi]